MISSSSSNSSSLPLARATKRSIVDNNNNNKQNNHKTILMMAVLMVCMLRFVLHEKQTMASYFDNDDSSASTTTTSCQTQQHQRRQNNNNNNYTQDTYSSFSNTICQALSHGALTPSSLWKSNLEAILQASIHPYDQERRIHKEWQQDLLHLLAPTLLERSIINLPSMQQVKDLVEMVDARRNYLLYQQLQQQQQPTLNTTTSISIAPSPLQVAVMGGSVPEGRGCDGFPAELSDWMANITRNHGGFTAMERNIRGKDCSWPFRLQLLADFFLGQGVVSIHNLAVGGTASGLALPTLEYRLYRNAELVEHGGPDVIINGFAVNDNMPAWGQDPNTTSRMEHWDGAFWQTQSFLNYGMNKAKPCRKPKPVVIYLDDYLGNQNGDVLLAEDQRSDSVRMTSDLNGLLYVSSPFPIKPFVMAKEPETSFSPKWTNKGNKRIVEGHYYQTEHQHVAYSLAYAILKSTVEHCVMDEFKILHQIKESSILSQSTKTLLALYPFPPTIDRTQALSTISRSWKDNAETLVYGEEKYCQSANAYADPCPFGFVATPAGTTPNQKALSSYLGRFIKENTGWYEHTQCTCIYTYTPK